MAVALQDLAASALEATRPGTGPGLKGSAHRASGLGRTLVRTAFALGSFALLQSGGRVLNALLGIQSGFSRELRQPGLAVEEPLPLALEEIDVDVQQLLRRAHRHQPGQALRPRLRGLLSQLDDLAPETLVAHR